MCHLFTKIPVESSQVDVVSSSIDGTQLETHVNGDPADPEWLAAHEHANEKR
jgi:hypothetical protein